MKKNLLYIFILSLSFAVSISAQVDLVLENGTSVFSYTFDNADQTDNKIGYSLRNQTDEAVEWYWRVELNDEFPSDWDVQVCDMQTCYNYNQLEALQANVLEAGASTEYDGTYIRVNSNGVQGEGVLKFTVYGDNKFENELTSTDFISSTHDDLSSDISIFPNPATQYIQFKEDYNISYVSIHNIVGKEVMSMKHSVGKNYDVSDLRDGMYIVRLLDKNSNVLKSLRLSKR